MPNSSGSKEWKPEIGNLGVDIQAAVRAELDSILAAPAFSHSARCKSFLSYVVQHALSGNTDQLKERMIGVRIFDRATDYDTGEDSIVRVTANEVRKRIGQFYQESKAAHSVQIDLPRGTYVPEFRIHPALRSSIATSVAAADSSDQEHVEEESTAVQEGLPSSAATTPEVSTRSQSENPAAKAPGRSGTRKLLFSISILVLMLVGAVSTLQVLRARGKENGPDIWGAFLNSKTPVLLCMGTHDIPDPNVQSSTAKEGFSDLVLHRNIIPIDDVKALTAIEKLLGKKGISFQIVGAEQVSLGDLQKQPVILVGASGNQWTLRLIQGLRYRIKVDWPQGQQPVASIVDADEPGHGEWKIDFSVPMNQWKHDYAIVAKEGDASIGVPVLIVAGLGNFGTVAASEILESSALTDNLSSDASCRGKSNFEAVIGTDLTDAQPGPPQVLRKTCW